MKQAIDNTSGPIFLVGAARSGTTLLQYMLRSHPDIYFPTAESHFIIPFYRRREEYGDLSNRDNMISLLSDIYRARKRFFDEDMNNVEFDAGEMADLLLHEQRTTFPQVVAGLYEANARVENKRSWGDKTPYYILHLPTILEIFPNARIIHLIRDGRDCSISMLKRKHDLQIFSTYHAAATWKKYVNAGQQFGRSHPDCYHEIRYEDILDKPEYSMLQLFRFLGEQQHDVSGYFSEHEGKRENADAAGRKTPLVGKPIKKDNQQKWRQLMSNRQVRTFEAIAGDVLARNGYPLVYSAPRISGLSRAANELYIRLFEYWHRFKRA